MSRISYFSTLFSVLFFTYTANNCSNNENFVLDATIAQQAQDWINYSIFNQDELLISQHDLQIILNLFYISYQRSYINLVAQEKATHLLNCVWHGWQNIAQRRRNPSKKIPYPKTYFSLADDAQQFASVLQQHEKIATTYDHAQEAVFKKNILENKLLKKNIEYVKDESRTVVTQALLDVQSHITHLMDCLQQHRRMRFDDEQLIDDLEITRGKIFDYLQEQLPHLAFNSLVKADNCLITTSEKNWQLLHTTQEVSNIIWHAIEKSRAHFYFTYYTLLYQRAEQLELPLYVLFDEQGLTKTDIRLPHPCTLAQIES